MDNEREVPGVYAKLNEVMGKVGRIPKTGRNDFHGYDYATEADIVDEIRPLMTDAGLAFIPSQGGERREVTVQTKSGETTVVKILHTFRFVDTEDGSEVEISVWGEGQDSMDKGSYKAFTGAEKYALLKTFMVATGDDPERDASHARPTRSRPSEKPQQKSRGPASDKQRNYIYALLKEREVPDEQEERIRAKVKTFTSKRASECIEYLEGLPEAEDEGKASSGPSTEKENEGSAASEAQQTTDDSDEGPDKDEWDDRSDVLMWFESTYGDEWEAKLNLFLSRHPDLSTPHEKLDRMSWNRIKRFVDEHDREGVEDPRQVLQGKLEGV